jgi:hypothetical protein
VPKYDVKIDLPAARIVSRFDDAALYREVVRVKPSAVLLVTGEVQRTTKEDAVLPPFAVVEIKKSPWSNRQAIENTAIALYTEPTELQAFTLVLAAPPKAGLYTLCVLWGDEEHFVNAVSLEVIE